MGDNGISDGIYIYQSKFKNCNVNGIVKARNMGNCEIIISKYDFDVSNEIPLVPPFYINKTDSPLNGTLLTVTTQDNNVIITLTDINSTKPIADVEISIINNDIVYSYEITDGNGQVILKDLISTFNFEFSYPGDDVRSYAPSSINKTFTFTKSQNTNQSTSSGSTKTEMLRLRQLRKFPKSLLKRQLSKSPRKLKNTL